MRRLSLPACSRLPLLAWLALPIGDAAAQFGRSAPPIACRARPPAPAVAAAGPARPAVPARAGADSGRPQRGALAQCRAVRRDQPRRSAGGAGRGGARRRYRIAQRAGPDADRCGGRPGADTRSCSTCCRSAPASASAGRRRTRSRHPGQAAPAAPAGAAPRPAPAVDRNVPMPAPVARNPRLWAGDGGAPQPDIGFLGFDAGRPAGAVPPPVPAAPRPARSAGGGEGRKAREEVSSQALIMARGAHALRGALPRPSCRRPPARSAAVSTSAAGAAAPPGGRAQFASVSASACSVDQRTPAKGRGRPARAEADQPVAAILRRAEDRMAPGRGPGRPRRCRRAPRPGMSQPTSTARRCRASARSIRWPRSPPPLRPHRRRGTGQRAARHGPASPPAPSASAGRAPSRRSSAASCAAVEAQRRQGADPPRQPPLHRAEPRRPGEDDQRVALHA